MTLYQNCSNRSAPLNKMADRAKNRKTFKRLLLNQKMDFEMIIQECFLGNPLPKLLKRFCYVEQEAGPRSAIGAVPDSLVRGPGFDTRSGNILSFLLPLFQEGQLSVTGESMCTKYWLTA